MSFSKSVKNVNRVQLYKSNTQNLNTVQIAKSFIHFLNIIGVLAGNASNRKDDANKPDIQHIGTYDMVRIMRFQVSGSKRFRRNRRKLIFHIQIGELKMKLGTYLMVGDHVL